MNVLITGARSGIGNDLAKTLAYLGYNVYGGVHRKKELETVEVSLFSNLKYIKFDITNPSDYEKINKYKIDILINQAGICIGGSFLDVDIDKLRENIDVNLISTVNLNKYFINYCYSNNKKGLILVTSSLIDVYPIPFLGSYILSKTALSMYSRILRHELTLSNSKVVVKLIKPGAYKTGFNRLMIDDIEDSKYFSNSLGYKRVIIKIFAILEMKKNNSIVNKMVKSIDDNSNKLVYSSPFIESKLTKLYKILFNS